MKRNYSSPPIREAVFDIRTETQNLSKEDFEKIHDLIKDKYPDIKKKISFSGHLTIQEFNSTSTENDVKPEFIGLIFINKEKNRHVQFRKDGFTLNYLPPYTNWDDFFKEALFLWKIYFKEIKPVHIFRIALRYINRINIPLPFASFQEYITNMPPIPKCLPQYYSNFFMQIEVPCEDEKYTAIITETIENPGNKTYLPFILDIDVYKEVGDDFNIDDFNEIRSIKNAIFENCITDKTRNLFK